MKQRVPFIVRLIVFLLVMATPRAFGGENSLALNYGMGILNVRSQSVAQSFRLTLPLLVPGDIKQGWQTFAQATWTNVWMSGPRRKAIFSTMRCSTPPWAQNTAILGQYLYSTSVIETIQGLDGPSHEVHLGLKFRLGKRCVMDLSIIENIITMDNSPDFGVHLAWCLAL